MASLFEQLFNCCEYKECDISNCSYDQGMSNGIVTTMNNNINNNNLNKSTSEEVKKKYSFIASSHSNNQSIHNNSKHSNNFFNKSNFDVSPINRSINDDNDNKDHINGDSSLGLNSLNNSSNFFNKNYMLTENIIVDEDIEYSPKLTLTGEKKTDDIFYGKELHIDAAGEESSLRNKRDGITLFGITQSQKTTNELDVIINLDSIITNNEIQKIFAIEYSKMDSNYYLHNIYKIRENTKPKQLLLYIRINHEYQLTSCLNNMNVQNNGNVVVYVLIGTLLSVFSVCSESNDICVKIYNEKGKDVLIEKTFTKIEKGKNYFTIGREECDINIEHKSVSKIHCTLTYSEYHNQWIIEDGNGKGKHSGNGIWLVLGYKGKFKLSMVEDSYCIKVLNKIFTVEINH